MQFILAALVYSSSTESNRALGDIPFGPAKSHIRRWRIPNRLWNNVSIPNVNYATDDKTWGSEVNATDDEIWGSEFPIDTELTNLATEQGSTVTTEPTNLAKEQGSTVTTVKRFRNYSKPEETNTYSPCDTQRNLIEEDVTTGDNCMLPATHADEHGDEVNEELLDIDKDTITKNQLFEIGGVHKPPFVTRELREPKKISEEKKHSDWNEQLGDTEGHENRGSTRLQISGNEIILGARGSYSPHTSNVTTLQQGELRILGLVNGFIEVTTTVSRLPHEHDSLESTGFATASHIGLTLLHGICLRNTLWISDRPERTVHAMQLELEERDQKLNDQQREPDELRALQKKVITRTTRTIRGECREGCQSCIPTYPRSPSLRVRRPYRKGWIPFGRAVCNQSLKDLQRKIRCLRGRNIGASDGHVTS